MGLRFKETVQAVTPPLIYDAMQRWWWNRAALARVGGERPDAEGATRGHRQAVGGLWDQIGQLQRDFLLQQGLQPEHRLLDIGCGSFRGGVHLIRYLQDGNYYGIDASADLLRAGRQYELPRYGLTDRTLHVLCNDQFEFQRLGDEFDVALAQSVFSHLPWNSILRCLVNIGKVLSEEGRFYATFFHDPGGRHRISPLVHSPGGITTYPDRDPYHYELDVFEELARRAGLSVQFWGDWQHPRNQQMLVFRRV